MQQTTKFINEAGLYQILSIKPLARIFMDKYFTDIMPKIRKTGKYILEDKFKNELKEINNKLRKEILFMKMVMHLYIITKIINNYKVI